MTKNSIMIDLDDPRTADIADVISNKTSKKILSLLSEGEFSEAEISSKLQIPINTIGYNIKKLENSGLIEKTKDYFWSVKGKRVHRYKVSNKRIVISPRTIIRGIIPAAITTVLFAFLIKMFGFGESSTAVVNVVAPSARDTTAVLEKAMEGASGAAPSAVDSVLANVPSVNDAIISSASSGGNVWAWFLLGGLLALAILIIWNLTKEK